MTQKSQRYLNFFLLISFLPIIHSLFPMVLSWIIYPRNFQQNLSHSSLGVNQVASVVNTTENNIFLSKNSSNLPKESLALKATINLKKQGSLIQIGNKKSKVPWIQWQEGNSTRIGISDMGAQKILGLEFFSNQNPRIQPIQWFSYNGRINTQQIGSYRYLDVTEFFANRNININWKINSDILELESKSCKITNIVKDNFNQNSQIIIDLNRPCFWQLRQTKDEAILKIPALPKAKLLEKYAPLPTINPPENFPPLLPNLENSPAVEREITLEYEDKESIIKIQIPKGNDVKVWSLETNKNQLIIDIKPDAIVPKEITWKEGIIWKQEYVTISTPSGNQTFPVNFLEIDLNTPNLKLKPITTNANSLVGIAPLLTTARESGVVAAINGGFFNRNNQLPLGAIRRDGVWLSSPILHRGAIGWNDNGDMKIHRLSLQETVTTSRGDFITVFYPNSGYMRAGVSRYTPEWGATYSPLSDNEVLAFVENNRVVEQVRAGKAYESSFPIPRNGYILTIRNDQNSANKLAVGTEVSRRTFTMPPELDSYSNILGAGPVLIQNRRIVLDGESEKFSKAFNRQKASRSAIATLGGNKIIIAAIHNRVPGPGPSLQELALIMKKLGAVDSLNLDGGSSTSMYLGGELIDRDPITAARVHNGLGIFISE